MTPDHAITYLTPAEIYAIAESVLQRRPDVRSRHLLQSAVARPRLAAFGAEAYPTLLDKAAALLHALAAHHVFYDGNKRTATLAVTRFLVQNGRVPTWDDTVISQFVLAIAQNQHDIPAIAAWLAAHSAAGEAAGRVRYLTQDEIAYINDRLTRDDLRRSKLGGMHKVRDLDLLASAALRPSSSAFGSDAYPTLEAKAAALMHSIARNHPFADGNKRTATVAGTMLLAVNGRRVTWNSAEALECIVALAEGALDHDSVAAWLATESCAPMLTPDAEADMRLIEDLIDAHRWLLDALAKR